MIVTKTDLVKGVYDCWVDVLEICTKNPLTVSSITGLIPGILTERDIAAGFRTFRKVIDYYIHPRLM